MIPVMAKTVGKMLEEWSKIMSSAAAAMDDGRVEIEVSEWFQNLAKDVITHTAFGSSYEDGRSIFQLQAQQMVYATEAYQKAFIPGYWYVRLTLILHDYFVTPHVVVLFIFHVHAQVVANSEKQNFLEIG